MKDDLLPKNLTGYWKDFDPADLYWIKQIGGLDLANVVFALDLPQRPGIYRDLDRLPKDRPLVMSFHVEYFWQQDLLDWFKSRPSQRILLLSDWNTYENFWPDNVTACKWTTWHHQLSRIIDTYGIGKITRHPIKKFSSLSSRHEWHRAAITAFLLSTLQIDDLVISWRDIRYDKNMYYLKDDQYLHPRIAELVTSDWFRNLSPVHSFVDPSKSSPLDHCDWHHPAYLECAVNLTNESIFNSGTIIDQKFFQLPGPYLTEKTWKPLLAGQAFIPVGQHSTVASLENLGLRFDWLREINFTENRADQDRMVALMDFLRLIIDLDCTDLWLMSQPDAQYNLDYVHSGDFARNCEKSNNAVLQDIDQWLVDAWKQM